jgi:hypothetical protein
MAGPWEKYQKQAPAEAQAEPPAEASPVEAPPQDVPVEQPVEAPQAAPSEAVPPVEATQTEAPAPVAPVAAEGPWTKYATAPAPKAEEKPPVSEPAGDGWRGTVAAGLRGIRESIPFARDIGAGAEALRKGVSFEEEKKAQEARDIQLAKEHPYAYGAGEVAGAIAPLVAAPEAAAGLLGKGAQAESAVAGKLGSLLGNRAEADLLTKVGTGALTGAAQGAVHGLGTGTGEERLQKAKEEALIGAPLGVLGAGLGNITSRGLRTAGEALGLLEKAPRTPTTKDIFAKGREAYEVAKNPEIGIKPESAKNLHGGLMADLEELGFDEDLNQKLKPALRKLRDITGPTSIEYLEKARKLTQAAAKDWQNPHNQMLAAKVRERIDDFVNNLGEQDIQHYGLTGPALSEAKAALKEGRQLWKQARKSETLDEMIEIAKNRAASTGQGANLNNVIRQEVKKIYNDAIRKNGAGWTPDELQAMRGIVRGGVTGNILRALGKTSPFHHTLYGGMEAIGSLASHDPTAIMGGALVGTPSHLLSEHLTKSGFENLKDIVKSGGSRANIKGPNPRESLYGQMVATPTVMAPLEIPDKNRRERASGGKVGKRDYPAKRLTRLERAAQRAHNEIAHETKPLLDRPDEQIVHALEIAKGR